MISCILLAAGLSKRFGSPKPLALINGVTVIEQMQQMLVGSNIAEIIIVLGAHYKKVKLYILNHKKIKVVYNKDYNLGQTSSFKEGLKAVVSGPKGFMALPVDFPAIKTDTINMIIDEFLRASPSILIPVYDNKKGHPPIFSAKMIDEFLALNDSQGLNIIQHRHQEQVSLFPVEDPGILATFNTPQEFQSLKNQ